MGCRQASSCGPSGEVSGEPAVWREERRVGVVRKDSVQPVVMSLGWVISKPAALFHNWSHKAAWAPMAARMCV